MKTNAVFLSVSRGGVTVNKEIVLGLEEEEFMSRFRDFEHRNSQYSCVFFTERELMGLLRLIEQKKGGSAIIG